MAPSKTRKGTSFGDGIPTPPPPLKQTHHFKYEKGKKFNFRSLPTLADGVNNYLFLRDEAKLSPSTAALARQSAKIITPQIRGYGEKEKENAINSFAQKILNRVAVLKKMRGQRLTDLDFDQFFAHLATIPAITNATENLSAGTTDAVNDSITDSSLVRSNSLDDSYSFSAASEPTSNLQSPSSSMPTPQSPSSSVQISPKPATPKKKSRSRRQPRKLTKFTIGLWLDSLGRNCHPIKELARMTARKKVDAGLVASLITAFLVDIKLIKPGDKRLGVGQKKVKNSNLN